MTSPRFRCIAAVVLALMLGACSLYKGMREERYLPDWERRADKAVLLATDGR